MLNTKSFLEIFFLAIFVILAILSAHKDVHAASVESKVAILKLPPTILSIDASDPDNSDPELSDGDTITVRFSEPTNKPDAATKSELDNFFEFSESLGSDYTGKYINPSTLVITIVDSENNGNPQVGTFSMTVKNSGNLKNAALLSEPSTDTSPTLTGSFGSKLGPFITDIIADDPDNSDPELSDGDTITVRFSEPTNKPDAATKSELDNFFEFSESLGSDYTGKYINPSTLVITIVDSENNGNPQVGTFSMTVKNSGNLKNADSSSQPSTSASPPLSGSFGQFSITIHVLDEGKAVTTLPKGTQLSITLPSGTSGDVVVKRTSASSSGPSSGSILSFVGDVVEITPTNGATCTGGCTMQFSFSSDDLGSDQDASDVNIFHDINDDVDFNDIGEQISTVVTEGETAGTFLAEASASFTSNFALGSVSTTSTSGGGGGGGDRTSPVFLSNNISSPSSKAIDGIISLDPNKSIETSLFEINDPIDINFSIYENQGPQAMQFLAIYTDIRGFESRYNSDLWIAWKNGQPVQVFDPLGYLYPNATVTVNTDKNNFEIEFHLMFSKSMETSDIVVYGWDQNRNPTTIKFKNAVKIIMPVSGIETDLSNENKTSGEVKPEQILTPQQTFKIPSWIETSAQRWSNDNVSDEYFMGGLYYLIKEEILSPSTKNVSSVKNIPDWFKKTARWWATDQISDREFISSIQWMIDRGQIVL